MHSFMQGARTSRVWRWCSAGSNQHRREASRFSWERIRLELYIPWPPALWRFPWSFCCFSTQRTAFPWALPCKTENGLVSSHHLVGLWVVLKRPYNQGVWLTLLGTRWACPKKPKVLFRLGAYFWVLDPALLDGFFILLFCCFMLRYFVQTADRGFVLDRFDWAFIVHECGRDVRETVILNVSYFGRCIRDIIKLLVLGQVTVRVAKFWEGDTKERPR